MHYEAIISEALQDFFEDRYALRFEKIEFQSTRKEFEGDLTVVLFPFLKTTRTAPADLGQDVGEYLVKETTVVESFNVVKGFLNLVLSDQIYIKALAEALADPTYGHKAVTAESPLTLVEYSSPNTNKPLHLGHIRNNLLGDSVANILAANGNRVVRTQIINDRGIHICKSMVAWLRFGNGETPMSSGLKGDQLVGKYYVLFDKAYKEEVAALEAKGITKKQAEKEAPLMQAAQEMLIKWESKDNEIRTLWKQMNTWVYDGFEATYKKLGIRFDSYYYESNTYLLGKDIVGEGLKKGLFYSKPDGSVWVDLTAEGLDEKLLLRADGTSVYMTQDLGTASVRVEDHPDITGMVYTVGNEQDYHFKVLFLILKKLGYPWAKRLYHLSYGMVDLPSGKMKSREGTVVDADDLILQMKATAQSISESVGKLDGLSETKRDALYHIIGLGALKYFILKVDPKKRILFDPEASVDFNGNTGPFIQYTHARIQTLLLKAEFQKHDLNTQLTLDQKEKAVIQQILLYPEVVRMAGQHYNPAIIANYLYDLVRSFNTFYQNISVLGAEDGHVRAFRIQLSAKVAAIISSGAALLGMQVPDRM